MIKELMNEHHDIALKIYKEEGMIHAMMIGYAGDKRFMFPLVFDTPEEKNFTLQMASIVLISMEAEAYTVSFEGWSLNSEKCDVMKENDRLKSQGLRFEDSPHRVEILSCMGSSYKNKCMRVYKIRQDDRTLEKMSEDSESMRLEGRFFELLPPQKPTPEQAAHAKVALKMGQDLGRIKLVEWEKDEDR